MENGNLFAFAEWEEVRFVALRDYQHVARGDWKPVRKGGRQIILDYQIACPHALAEGAGIRRRVCPVQVFSNLS